MGLALVIGLYLIVEGCVLPRIVAVNQEKTLKIVLSAD